MNTTSFPTEHALRWKTYLKAIAFVFPAVIAWAISCYGLIPSIQAYCSTAQLDSSKVGWLWHAPTLFVWLGWLFFVGSALILALLELFARGWARHRRVTVGILVWVLNFSITSGLIMLLVLLSIAAYNLSHAN